MAEAIVMIGFFLLLVILQYREQQLVEIKIHKSFFQKLLSLGIAISILWIFWPGGLANQVKLLIFALLLISFAWFREGLGENRIVKTGFLDAPYTNFQQVTLEAVKDEKTFVTFYQGKKNNTTSFFVNKSLAEVEVFLKEHAQLPIQRISI